jgi:hypothetical protein
MKIAASLTVAAAVVVLAACSPSGHLTSVDGSPSPSGVPTPPTGPGAGPEQPRDLVGPPMTVTGAVTVADGCVVLDTGSKRWALLGDRAGQLRDGHRVTVRGRPEAVPAGCRADSGLRVILVS